MTAHEHDPTMDSPPSYTRRAVLGAGAVAALAGCLGDGETDEPAAIPDPVALDEGQTCDNCGMVIDYRPGMNAEIFYRGDRPEGRDGPARFCAIQCLNTYHATKDRLGWEPLVTYATNYAAVEYTLDQRNGATYISTHTEQEAFAQVDDLHVVTGTGIQGAMGDTPVPFTDREAAQTFATEHGGRVVDWAAVLDA